MIPFICIFVYMYGEDKGIELSELTHKEGTQKTANIQKKTLVRKKNNFW